MARVNRPGAEQALAALPLHPHDFRILMALVEGPSFGTEIVRTIEAAEPNTRLYPANLFRRIRDLLERGLLEDSPTPKDADPRRSYVRLTQVGHEVARAEAHRLNELVREAAALDLLPGA